MRCAFTSHDVNRMISGLKKQPRSEIRGNASSPAISHTKWSGHVLMGKQLLAPKTSDIWSAMRIAEKLPLRCDAFSLRFALPLRKSAAIWTITASATSRCGELSSCDTKTLRFVGPRCTRATDGSAAKLVRRSAAAKLATKSKDKDHCTYGSLCCVCRFRFFLQSSRILAQKHRPFLAQRSFFRSCEALQSTWEGMVCKHLCLATILPGSAVPCKGFFRMLMLTLSSTEAVFKPLFRTRFLGGSLGGNGLCLEPPTKTLAIPPSPKGPAGPILGNFCPQDHFQD